MGHRKLLMAVSNESRDSGLLESLLELRGLHHIAVSYKIIFGPNM